MTYGMTREQSKMLAARNQEIQKLYLNRVISRKPVTEPRKMIKGEQHDIALLNIENYIRANTNNPYLTSQIVCEAVGVPIRYLDKPSGSKRQQAKALALREAIQSSKKEAKEKAKKQLASLLAKTELSNYEIGGMIGMSNVSIHNFSIGESFPRQQKLEQLLEVLGTNFEDFLGTYQVPFDQSVKSLRKSSDNANAIDKLAKIAIEGERTKFDPYSTDASVCNAVAAGKAWLHHASNSKSEWREQAQAIRRTLDRNRKLARAAAREILIYQFEKRGLDFHRGTADKVGVARLDQFYSGTVDLPRKEKVIKMLAFLGYSWDEYLEMIQKEVLRDDN